MRVYLILLFLSFHFVSFSQKAIPELWGLHVHDEAHYLSKQTIEYLENQLKVYEDSTSNQLAVLIIPTLDGDVLEEYSLKVAEKWKLGQEDKDNGALLLVVIEDHKMRIEAGIGLEGALTDAVCSRIIRNELAPHFRSNDYDEGVKAGVNAMIAAIGNEYTPADSSSDNTFQAPEMTWQERLMIGAFVFGILGLFTFMGLFIPGCGGWFLYAFLIPFYATFPMFILGVNGGVTTLIAYAIGFPILKLTVGNTPWGKRLSNKVGKGSKGARGWSSGSSWSSGGSSSNSSSGGFSGGGGSFGGGGASGGW
jgi:uncharacterized protein